MELVIKLGSAAVLASAVCLLLKKSNPEMGLPLALMVCAGGFILCAGLLGPIISFLERARKVSGLSDAMFYPVVKSVGIGICARISGEVCRDSGQAAMAGSVETLGCVCALYASLPLMESLLDMLEEML